MLTSASAMLRQTGTSNFFITTRRVTRCNTGPCMMPMPGALPVVARTGFPSGRVKCTCGLKPPLQSVKIKAQLYAPEKRMTDMQDDLRREIREFFNQALASPDNSLGAEAGARAWDDFILGAASGGDAIFNKFKAAAGPYHYTPLELFKKAFPDSDAAADELSVLCWVLPVPKEARDGNRQRQTLPALRWGQCKYYGENFYNRLGAKLVEFFAARGIQSVFPMGRPDLVSRVKSEKFYLTSNWSERHACHAAGLGTFGLCDALITPAGKAHRCGSVVAKTVLKPTPRDYRGYRDYCLWYTKGTCGLCARRCPSGALTTEGHDKERCQKYLHGPCAEVFQAAGFKTFACGLCQTGVPCEDRIPGRAPTSVHRGFIDE